MPNMPTQTACARAGRGEGRRHIACCAAKEPLLRLLACAALGLGSLSRPVEMKMGSEESVIPHLLPTNQFAYFKRSNVSASETTPCLMSRSSSVSQEKLGERFTSMTCGRSFLSMAMDGCERVSPGQDPKQGGL